MYQQLWNDAPQCGCFSTHKICSFSCDVKHEPAHLSDVDNKRPDVMLCTLPKPTLLDVLISHPSAPSHQASAKRSALRVAEEATKRKHKKYAGLVQLQDAIF
jgi:hypothetical protein